MKTIEELVSDNSMEILETKVDIERCINEVAKLIHKKASLHFPKEDDGGSRWLYMSRVHSGLYSYFFRLTVNAHEKEISNDNQS